MIVPDFSYESRHSGLLVAGLDEVGYGPWAGPVVAGAFVFLSQDVPPFLIQDSKKLTPAQRDKIMAQLAQGQGVHWHYTVGQASVDEIDTMGIRPATNLAMARAVQALPCQPEHILIDGIVNPFPAGTHPVTLIKKGDSLSLSIAAASIVAKTYRDDLMVQLGQEYPAYGWGGNAGYGTAAHQQALADHGVTPHHRRSYKPIAALLGAKMRRADGLMPEFITSPGLIPYDQALAAMEAHVQALQQGHALERVWFLEHPSVYTAGASLKDVPSEIHGVPVYKTGRGGKITYHGPGQRIIYVMLDLRARRMDLRAYVQALEGWIQCTLQELGIQAEPRADRVGLWVPKTQEYEEKIAALGVRVQKWITSHGIALNLSPHMSFYEHITPCGIQGHGITSLEREGCLAALSHIDLLLEKNFTQFF
jgi:lipoyl(octanoyl) transferase